MPLYSISAYSQYVTKGVSQLCSFKKKKIINIKMTFRNFAYSVCHSSLYQPLYYPVRSQTETLVQRLFAVSNSCNSWFSFLDSVQCRAAGSSKHMPGTNTYAGLGRKQPISVAQCLTETVPCRVLGKALGGLFPIFFQKQHVGLKHHH